MAEWNDLQEFMTHYLALQGQLKIHENSSKNIPQQQIHDSTLEELLVEEVRSQRCLWDTFCWAFKELPKKQQAWKLISAKLEKQVFKGKASSPTMTYGSFLLQPSNTLAGGKSSSSLLIAWPNELDENTPPSLWRPASPKSTSINSYFAFTTAHSLLFSYSNISFSFS